MRGEKPKTGQGIDDSVRDWGTGLAWRRRVASKSWLSLCSELWQEAPLPFNRIFGFRPPGPKLVM